VRGELQTPTSLPLGKVHDTHWTGRMVGPRAGLERVEKKGTCGLIGNQTKAVAILTELTQLMHGHTHQLSLWNIKGTKYGVITNDVSSCINVLERIAHII
jgi:hypothetical protein